MARPYTTLSEGTSTALTCDFSAMRATGIWLYSLTSALTRYSKAVVDLRLKPTY